jgi:hypothetical protein
MLTLEKRIHQWKKWVNRNKQFRIEELEELENHLREEILYLTEHDNVPEQKAFDQALDILGEKGLLDEEFGKIRKSKFDKVKLWAFLQTFVILGLVMFIVTSNIPNDTQNKILINIDPLIGERIGWIKGWQIEKSDFSIENNVTYQNDSFFYNSGNKNIYCFGNFKSSENLVLQKFVGTYFLSSPNDLNDPIFEIDAQKYLYYLVRNSNKINVYKNSQLIKTINLPDTSDSTEVVGFKIIDNYLILCKNSLYSKDSTFFVPSYLLITTLDSKIKIVNKIILKNPILLVDRSEDEIAILARNGMVNIFTFKNQKLILIKELKIIDLEKKYHVLFFLDEPYNDEILYGKQQPVFFFTKKNHQMAIKFTNPIMYVHIKEKGTEKNDPSFCEYFYLQPKGDTELTMTPIVDKDFEGLLKVTYMKNERLVSIRDKIYDRLMYSTSLEHSMLSIYLFKD